MERDECRENWEWKANQSLMLPLWKLHLKFCLSNPEVGNPLTFILNLLSYCDAVFKRWNQNLYKKQSRMLSNILKNIKECKTGLQLVFFFLFIFSAFQLFVSSTIFCLFSFLSFTFLIFFTFQLFVYSTFHSVQMSEGSQVSKVTLCVQILKWQCSDWATHKVKAREHDCAVASQLTGANMLLIS